MYRIAIFRKIQVQVGLGPCVGCENTGCFFNKTFKSDPAL